MTFDEIAASWATRGDLARSASFRAVIEGNRLVLVADVMGLGPGGNRMARAWKEIPLPTDDADIETALTAMYTDLGDAIVRGEQLAQKTFTQIEAGE